MNHRNWKYAVIASLPVQILLFTLLTYRQDWIEGVYIKYIFGYMTLFLRFVTGGTRFPIGMASLYVLVFMALFALISGLIRLVKGKLSPKTSFINLLVTVTIVYGIYMSMWGLAYHRRPVARLTKINTEAISTQELAQLCERLIYLTNESRKRLTDDYARSPASDSLFRKAPLGYAVLARTIPELTYACTSIKFGLTNDIMAYLGTAGLYYPFSGEANVNGINPTFRIPFTVCHEMAHQLGFASEEEANYIAYLTCMNNPDPVFQYSANYEIMYYTLYALARTDEKLYARLSRTINDDVAADNRFLRNIWTKYDIPLQEFASDVIYDFFLKANSQESGIKSYGLVVELMIGEYRKNRLTYKLTDSGLLIR